MDIVRHPSEAEQVLRMLPGQLRGLRKLPPEAGLPACISSLPMYLGLQIFDACPDAHLTQTAKVPCSSYGRCKRAAQQSYN